MIVRPATPADIDRVIGMVYDFNAAYYDVPLCPTRTQHMVELVVGEGVIFISDTGFIAGMVTDDLFREWTILQEFGWYATDRSGIALLDAFILAGRDLTVNEVRLSTLSTSPAGVGKLLLSRGFAPLDQSYRLMIGAP